MKIEEITYNKKVLTLSVDDVKELLPDEKFHYEMYWDYRDEISKEQFKKYMPSKPMKEYEKKDGSYDWSRFADDWRTNIEEDIREMSIGDITSDIDRDLTEMVKDALKKKWIEFDELELDFYPDDLFSIDLDVDYLLSRSKIDWNVIWINNYDWFNENEVYEDWTALKELVDLYPDLVDKNDLEKACAEWIYAGSDLKISFRHSMEDFLEILHSGEVDLSGTEAVLHNWINGSWSPEFTLGKWKICLGKQIGATEYDYWDWELDWKYGIVDVYGCVFNNNY